VFYFCTQFDSLYIFQDDELFCFWIEGVVPMQAPEVYRPLIFYIITIIFISVVYVIIGYVFLHSQGSTTDDNSRLARIIL